MIAERVVPVRDTGRAGWARDLWTRKPWRQVRLPGLFRLVIRHPRDTIGAIVGAAILIAIIANSLFMQPGPHPAPIFAIRPPPVVREETGTVAQVPRPRPAAATQIAAGKIDPVPLPRPRAQPAVAAGSRPDPIADLLNPGRQLSAVQRVLNEYGYGPVAVTGTMDDATRQGIERFERDHSLPVSGQNTARLRQALGAATGRSLD
jgi:Putative peptidoglycan binding domain